MAAGVWKGVAGSLAGSALLAVLGLLLVWALPSWQPAGFLWFGGIWVGGVAGCWRALRRSRQPGALATGLAFGVVVVPLGSLAASPSPLFFVTMPTAIAIAGLLARAVVLAFIESFKPDDGRERTARL